jgi:phage-related protein
MTSIAIPLPSKISLESTKKTTFRQVAAQFGDGYTQVAPNGLNNRIDTWDIVWGGLSSSEKTTVETAINSIGTWGTFLWTPCDETIQKKFRISGDISYQREGTRYKVTLSLKQVFDI